jgi:hypothetical protein
MFGEELASHDNVTECLGAAVPVPVVVFVVVDGWALLVKVSVALAAPVTWGLKVTVKEALLPAAMVTGNESPLRVNAELFEVAAVTVTSAPLALRLPEADPLVPTTTLPTPTVAGVAVNCPTTVAPLPDNGIVKVGFDAFEVIVRLPLTVFVDSGANETLKVALCPTAKSSGAAIPLKLNPDPLIPILEMLTPEVPVLVTVSDNCLLLPTFTPLNVRLVGSDPSVPGAASTPVPESESCAEAFEASLVIETVALKAAAELGVNITLSGDFCPAAIVTGRLGPVSEKYLVEIAALLIVTEAVPVFSAVRASVLLVPSVTLPKSRLLPLRTRLPICCC